MLMRRSKNLPVWLLVVGAVVSGCVLSGCADKPVKPLDPDAFEDYLTSVEQAQQEKPARRYRGRGESVGIPQNALWLGLARTPHFKFGKAQMLIEALAAPHPVVLKVHTDDNPTVSAPASALILKDYFDSFAVQSNWTYSVDNGVIIFEDWQTRSIELASLVGITAATLKSFAGAGVSAQENELTVATDPYMEIELIVTEILKATGANNSSDEQSGETATTERQATFSVSRSANTLFISARPNQIREVVKAIEIFNKSVSKRVIFDVTVYDVSLSGGDNRSLNVDLLRTIADQIIGVKGGGDSLDGLSISRASRLSGAETQPSTSSLILSWIQSQGVVSKRIHRRFEVLNNHTATFLDTTEIEFLKSVAIAPPVDGVSQPPTVEIGNHRIGRSFNLFATVIGWRVNVQLNINERAIAAIKDYTLPGNSGGGILYDISNNDRVISLSLVDGETRILTYFQGDNTEKAHSKNVFLPLLGDKIADASEKTESVIVISATIVE